MIETVADRLVYILLIMAGFIGFVLAWYLHHKKQTGEHLACPLKGDCAAVITSEYSRFLGIPVELLGMAYYLAVALSYALFVVVPNLATPFAVFSILALSTAAFLFSIYLTFIQIALLKQLCTWCLVSAGLCTIIFFLAVSGTALSFVDILDENHRLILGIHVLGVALGLGASTSTDIFFFKFSRDFKISQHEAEVMHTLSQVIWFGLALLVLSGIGLYLPHADVLNTSSKFLTKMVVVLVIIINGALLNLKISPQLVHMTFGGPETPKSQSLRHMRKLAFALGAISATSWYSAFVLGMTRSIPLKSPTLLLIYLGLLAVAVTASQFIERRIAKSSAPAAGSLPPNPPA